MCLCKYLIIIWANAQSETKGLVTQSSSLRIRCVAESIMKPAELGRVARIFTYVRGMLLKNNFTITQVEVKFDYLVKILL